jgi:FKBP-type peptidyl-prolyl cis-trans isomerase
MTTLALVSCKKNGGFKDTKFGFQYKMHTEGKGAKPQAGDVIEFHQYVRKGDSLIQSTRQMNAPIKIRFPETTKGDKFLEAIKMLSSGDSMTVKLVVDSLGQVRPPFKSGDVIYFDFKMIKVTPKAEADKAAAAMQAQATGIQTLLSSSIESYKSGKLKPQTTSTGLKYQILEQGSGPKGEAGNTVTVNYIGKLKDGTEFDSSFSHGDSYTFPLGKGQVIPGWDEGLQLLNEGGKGIFFIPASLGYGDKAMGKIPANSELIFYIELIKAK